jgi:hypothetical protein
VTHDRALLVLAQELENTLRHDDAGVRAKQPISEGGRIPVWDEADAGRAEAVVVGHLMHELMHRGIARFDRGVVEELKLVEPAQRQVGQPRANQPDEKIDDDGEDDCRGQIDLAIATMAARTSPITMPTRMPKVISDAKKRRANWIPPGAMSGASLA